MNIPSLPCYQHVSAVLVSTNGERFVGTVITETSSNVVFDSEPAGRPTFSQSKIRDLERASLQGTTNGVTATVDLKGTACLTYRLSECHHFVTGHDLEKKSSTVLLNSSACSINVACPEHGTTQSEACGMFWKI